MKRQLRVVSGGQRFLVKDRSGKDEERTTETYAKKLESRFAQEAVELVMPYVSKRVVLVDNFADTSALLRSKTKSLPVRDLVSDASKKQLDEFPPGGCIILLTTEDGRKMPVAAVKTRHALNIYVDDNEVAVIKQLCGVPIAPAAEVPA